MSHLPLGGGSDERTEDTAQVCTGCGFPVALSSLGTIGVEGGGLYHAECWNEVILEDQRLNRSEAYADSDAE